MIGRIELGRRGTRGASARLAGAAFALALVAGCDSGTSPGREPTTIRITPGSLAFDALDDAVTLAVEVLDRDGQPMSGVSLSWMSQNPNVAQVSSTGTVTSTGNGTTGVSVSAGSASRTVSVSVLQVATTLEVLAGNGQEGAAGENLPLALRLRLLDRLARPVQGRGVSFTVLEGGGSVTPNPATTSTLGVAVAAWRLGTVAGAPQRVLASVVGAAGLSVELQAVARAGSAFQLVKDAGDGQSDVRGATLPLDLVARLVDAFGNPVAGGLVTFLVTGGGGSVSPGSDPTGPDGRASTTWTLGNALGTQTVTASATGTTPVVFTATALAVPGELRAESSTQQTATVGQAVPVPPSVRLLDTGGQAIPGSPVTFQIESGGGSVTSPGGGGGATTVVVVTDASGLATVGSWILGPIAGSNTLRASAAGGVSTLFSATGTTGPASVVQKVSGDGQTAGLGATLSSPLVVQVTDQFGNVVPGVTVTFTPDAGSGSASPASAPTASSGRAQTSWTIGGTNGQHRLTASIPGGASTVFTATASAGAGAFDVTFEFVGGASAEVQAAFAAAAARWSQIIVGDLPDVTATVNQGTCENPQTRTLDIDDLYVFVVQELPAGQGGPGGVLAQAGPCLLRSGNGLPYVARVRLDPADVPTLIANGRLTTVVMHELAHTFGFGTLWNGFGLLRNPSVGSSPPFPDTHFVGAAAVAAFNAVGGTSYTGGAKVPVQNNAQQGTADSHWRNIVFGSELMIGTISSSNQPLSRVTAASLADLGYAVNESAADAYTLPSASALDSLVGDPEIEPLLLVDDVLPPSAP